MVTSWTTHRRHVRASPRVTALHSRHLPGLLVGLAGLLLILAVFASSEREAWLETGVAFCLLAFGYLLRFRVRRDDVYPQQRSGADQFDA